MPLIFFQSLKRKYTLWKEGKLHAGGRASGGGGGAGEERVSPAVTDGLGEEMQVLVDFQAIL